MDGVDCDAAGLPAGLPEFDRIVEGVGLSLTREHLELLYGQSAELSVRPGGGGGVARIALPFRTSTDG